MKINLGCNQWKLEGFINIDLDPNQTPDVVCDATKLPYKDNSIDEIYAGHLLEHVENEEETLTEWKRVLKPKGIITISVPDVEKALKELKSGHITQEWFQKIVFGSHITKDQNHHRVYTEQILIDSISRYFPNNNIIEDCPYLVAKVSWQTIIVAIKL